MISISKALANILVYEAEPVERFVIEHGNRRLVLRERVLGLDTLSLTQYDTTNSGIVVSKEKVNAEKVNTLVYFTTTEAGRKLKATTRQIRNLCVSKELDCIQRGRYWYVEETSINKYRRRHKKKP